jgi:NAD-dependent dihydropyrimidine dehydrogenase PreA subunit
MIEILSASRCTSCNVCVKICPANVFEAVPGGLPIIARQDDCQTCYLCEIYCPVDALYVAIDPEAVTGATEAEIERAGLFGSYARALGWKKGREGGADRDPTHSIRRAFTGERSAQPVKGANQ